MPSFTFIHIFQLFRPFPNPVQIQQEFPSYDKPFVCYFQISWKAPVLIPSVLFHCHYLILKINFSKIYILIVISNQIMAKSLLLYDLKNKNNVEKTHIVRSLFGYEDKSNMGKYTYKRKGLLSKFKYEKWDKSAIVIDIRNEEKVKNMLRKFGLNVLIMRLPKRKG